MCSDEKIWDNCCDVANNAISCEKCRTGNCQKCNSFVSGVNIYYHLLGICGGTKDKS
jgi:hypothetical protein